MHDEVKDKNFELELSWVGESKYLYSCIIFKYLYMCNPHLKSCSIHTVLDYLNDLLKIIHSITQIEFYRKVILIYIESRSAMINLEN